MLRKKDKKFLKNYEHILINISMTTIPKVIFMMWMTVSVIMKVILF